MKKNITIFFTLLLIGASAYIIIFSTPIKKNTLNPPLQEKNTGSNKKQEVEKKAPKNKKIEQLKIVKTKEEKRENIREIKDTFAKRGLLNQGDIFFDKKQLNRALRTYLTIERKESNNFLIKKRIGDTYYEMKKYKNSYKYYKEIFGKIELDENKVIISYLATLELEKLQLSKGNEITIDISNIKKIGLKKENIFFLETSLLCLSDQKKCQNDFESYIKTNKIHIQSNLNYVKKALSNYKDFGVKDQYFKNTQFLTAIFQAEFYPISNILGEKILLNKKGYLPVIKIISQGYYKLGLYDKARDKLKIYTNFDKKDPQIYYMLGIISIKKHDYILSNIYFIKARKLGFSPISSVSRRLIYNYYLIEDFPHMFKEFNTLLKTKESTVNDYSIAIYYAIIHENKTKLAGRWIETALTKFPKKSDFYAYKGWLLKQNNKITEAEEVLKKGFKINKHNPLINLNLGIIERSNKNLRNAKIYLRNTVIQNPDGDFGKMAQIELEEIQKQELLQE